MNKKDITSNTYTKDAHLFSTIFSGMESRLTAIQKTIAISKKPNPNVLEIGCGDGRDAKEIIKFTNNYLGIDISSGMINIAKNKNPHINFEIADMETFKFPENLDIIFAFASVLHSNKTALSKIFQKAHHSLTDDGLFYISTKQGSYQESKKIDEHGARYFYFYELSDVISISNRYFEVIYHEEIFHRNNKWLELLLKKIS